MKSFTLTVVGVLLTVFVVVNADVDPGQIKKMFAEIVAVCKDKISSENLVKWLQNMEAMSSNEEVKCFKACSLTYLEIMKEGKLQMDKIEENVNSILGNDKKDVAKSITDTAKSCIEEANKEANECDVAGMFVGCVKKFNIPK